MKILSVFEQESKIVLDDLNMLTIVIESKKILCNIEKHIRLNFSGAPLFFYKEDQKHVDIDERADVVSDMFVLDYNSKKNVNSLFKRIKNLNSEDVSVSINNFKRETERLVNTISMDFDFDLIATDDVGVEDIARLITLRIKDEEENYIYRFVNYCKVVNELRNIDLFFVFRMHDYLTEDEILFILKELSYKNIKIINIEHKIPEFKTNNEKIIIYDKDLCLLF